MFFMLVPRSKLRDTLARILGLLLNRAPAADVVVTDQLPEGLEFVEANQGGRYRDGQVRWDLGTVAPGQSMTLRLRMTAQPPEALSDPFGGFDGIFADRHREADEDRRQMGFGREVLCVAESKHEDQQKRRPDDLIEQPRRRLSRRRWNLGWTLTEL